MNVTGLGLTDGQPPKLCKDCRWARRIGEGSIFGPHYECDHPTATVPPVLDLVTGRQGSPSQTLCHMVRGFTRSPEDVVWCGKEGRFWEPIEIGFGSQ